MNITPMTVVKAIGVVLLGVFLWHISGMPWGLIGGAGVALVVLP